jgi:hypothetical protein
MQKLLIAVSVWVLFATVAFGQTVSQDWQTYSPVNEEFSAEFPATVDANLRFNKKDKEIYAGNYRALNNGSYYFVFSINEGKDLETEPVRNFSEKFKPTESSVEFGTLIGKQLKFADDEGFFQQVIFVNSKHRKYVFHAVSETENDPSVARFFESLKFYEDINEETTATRTDKILLPKTNMPKVFTIGTGTMNGEKILSAPTASLPTNVIPNPFKILSQPRANYTDLARQYDIMGAVRLKVTFLPDGTIGKVLVLAKLPFGMTNNAIEAAKAIKFVPGTVTISKTVEYRFILY